MNLIEQARDWADALHPEPQRLMRELADEIERLTAERLALLALLSECECVISMASRSMMLPNTESTWRRVRAAIDAARNKT